MSEYNEKIIKPFLDAQGRVAQYPAKRAKQLEVLRYLATKLTPGTEYTEAQVGDILCRWHTFGDHCLLRRDMADAGLLARRPDGSSYALATGEAAL